MMPLIVECRIPSQMIHRDLQIFGDGLGLASQEIPPSASVIESQPNGILPPQGENCGVNMAGIFVQFLRNLA